MLGLFGKLPAKRDFVSRNVPTGVLTVLEPWLQQSIAQSKMSLGQSWNDAYLVAPIWRFWLATGICGQAAQGAMMPSADGVGRYFPLVLMAIAERGLAFPEPTQVDEPWYDSLELVLLSALAQNETLDAVTRRMGALREPDLLVSHVAPGAEAQSARSIWWTMGGPQFPAQRVVWSAMPPPTFFMTILTGAKLDERRHESAR